MTEPPAVERALVPVTATPGARTGPAVRLDLVLWLGLIAAAAGLRLARLDALPLTFDESARAFQALRVSQNAVPEGWSGDLAGALTSYVFRVFGEGELAARVVPAVGGSAAVAAMWLGGRAFGGVAALAAGVLLALSPLAVLFSRTGAPFTLGTLVAVAMAVSLLSYLRRPRALTAFTFAVAFALAPSTDAVATTAAIAVVTFLLLDPVLFPQGEVVRAWRAFRRSPSHWLSVALTLAAGLELGLTHFGTSIDRLGLAGLTQWGDMFALPRDGRAPGYQLVVLLAYDWPLALGGALALAVIGWRLLRRGAASLTAARRLALLWTALAALTVGLATQREGGQVLILTVPLAMLAGLLIEDVVDGVDWRVLRRWWPAAVAALLLLAYGGLMMTAWAETGASEGERVSIVVAAGGAAALAVAGYAFLGRAGSAVAVTVAGVAAFAFLVHSSLALVRQDDGAELAVDLRTDVRIERFVEAVEEIAAIREGVVLVDPALAEPLLWYLRDAPVAFARPDDEAGAVVVPADGLEGFAPVGERWRIGEGWYPREIETLPLWRWLAFREPYDTLNSVDSVDVRILVPAP